MATFYEEHAQLLYDMAKSHHVIDAVYQDVQLFKEGVGGEMPFMQMITRDSIPNSSKAMFLEEISQLFQTETRQFFDFFIREAKFEYIYRALKQFELIYKKHHLVITSAVALTNEQIERIISKASQKMKREIYTYDTIIDELIIGGVKVQSHDFIIDATVLSKLQTFKKTI